MALSLFSRPNPKPDQLFALDLGGRITKAIHVQRKANGLALTRYALVDAPIYERSLSVDLLTEHLKAVVQALDTKGRMVALAVGPNDAVTRHIEMPVMPVAEMRQVLKNSPKIYLQQELTHHVFDCCPITPPPNGTPAEKPKLAAGPAKQKVFAVGAKAQFVEDIQAAVQGANLYASAVMPALIGPVNAFELAMPEVFAKEVVALVDIGFKNSTICLLQEGELILSRVVNLGGDKLTEGLAEALNISYAEAEGIKVGMPQEVQANLESLVAPLGREMRALIDFFEHQQDRPVTQVFVSGGSARSDFILQILQAELMIECKRWNPVSFLELALPADQLAELDHVAPQLAVAVGTAVAAL